MNFFFSQLFDSIGIAWKFFIFGLNWTVCICWEKKSESEILDSIKIKAIYECYIHRNTHTKTTTIKQKQSRRKTHKKNSSWVCVCICARRKRRRKKKVRNIFLELPIKHTLQVIFQIWFFLSFDYFSVWCWLDTSNRG